jgi:hypothetical protein
MATVYQAIDTSQRLIRNPGGGHGRGLTDPTGEETKTVARIAERAADVALLERMTLESGIATGRLDSHIELRHLRHI